MMSPRTLFILGSVWFGLAAVWMWRGPKQLFHLWQGAGIKRGPFIIAAYLLSILYQAFIVGWVIPFGMGLYRSVRK